MSKYNNRVNNRISLAILISASITVSACSGGGGSSNGTSPEAEINNRINRSNISTTGNQVDTQSGFRSEGVVTIAHNDYSTVFTDAVLDFDVNDEGTVVDIKGSTIVPTNLSNDVIIEGNVKSIVDMMTGAEANAIDEIDIWLQEDRRYLIYYVNSEFKIIHTGIDGVEGSTVTLKPPLGGSILLVSDPTDPFFYTFAAVDILGGYGAGDSYHGLIPYVPDLPYTALDMFDGHDIERITDFGIGVKAFDVMSFTGTKIIRSDNKLLVALDKALEPQQDYKAGFNGSAKVDLRLFGVGFFSFDAAQTSATIAVTNDQQQMAMQTLIEPDVSWVPSWLPIIPTSRTQGEWMVNGDGSFEANLESSYKSELPVADLFGSIKLNNDGATFIGRDNSGSEPLGIKAMFRNNLTTVEVETNVDFDLGITDGVIDSLDRELSQITQWQENLTKRTSNYELEVSLRGLRSALPAIADNAIATLGGVPNKVRTSVDSSIVAEINRIDTLNLISKANTNNIADGYADAAKAVATTKSNNMIRVMQNLKTQALKADDESLRAALKSALNDAYDNREYSQKITVKRNILGKERTLYNKTLNYTILSATNASKIKEAADNAHKIQETSDLKIEAEEILAGFRADDLIKEIKQDVEDGLAAIPSLDGLGYTVYQGQYEAFINLDGTIYGTEVNMLNKDSIYTEVYDLMASITK